MALIDYIKHGYPKDGVDTAGQRKIYVMVGPTATLTPLRPALRSAFDGAPVDKTNIESLAKPTYCEMTVETFIPYTQATAQITDNQYPYYEIDWIQVEKNLRQHPAFDALTAEDWVGLDQWEKETDTGARFAFQYYKRDNDGAVTGSVQTLTGSSTTGAQAYATLRLLGVESFLDFSPVARKTSKYQGNSAPATSDAGQKAGGDPFTGVPAAYEWLKTADRSSKQGTNSNDWIRQEEWTGARKILLDKDDLFLT